MMQQVYSDVGFASVRNMGVTPNFMSVLGSQKCYEFAEYLLSLIVNSVAYFVAYSWLSILANEQVANE